MGLGERKEVTLDRQGDDISFLVSVSFNVPLVAAVASQVFIFTVKSKLKALLAEVRTFRSDISVLRAAWRPYCWRRNSASWSRKQFRAVGNNVPNFR